MARQALLMALRLQGAMEIKSPCNITQHSMCIPTHAELGRQLGRKTVSCSNSGPKTDTSPGIRPGARPGIRPGIVPGTRPGEDYMVVSMWRLHGTYLTWHCCLGFDSVPQQQQRGKTLWKMWIFYNCHMGNCYLQRSVNNSCLNHHFYFYLTDKSK